MRVLLLGFGNVGRSFCKLLEQKRKSGYLSSLRDDISVTGVATRSHGTIYGSGDPLSLGDVIAMEDRTGRIDGLRGAPIVTGMTVQQMIDTCEYDVLVESTVSDLDTGEPAFRYMSSALQQGRSVITSNKASVALHYSHLKNLADLRGGQFLFESSVMAGTPLFSLARYCLPAIEISAFEGVINGTSNYMLGLMRNGASLDEALMDVRRRGYAEANPAMDVDGWDSALKSVIVAQAIMGARDVDWNSISVEGIRKVTPALLKDAVRRGGAVRLVASVEKRKDSFDISVCPRVLAANHPLASLEGVTNGALFVTDALGEICITGAGAGSEQTAYGIFRDMLSLI